MCLKRADVLVVCFRATARASSDRYPDCCRRTQHNHTQPHPLIHTAGLGAGVTEAVLVVNPMEVVKIRLQAQQHSLADPLEAPRYRSAAHALYTIVRTEGAATLYRGVSLTALRQATNQGAYPLPRGAVRG